MSKVITDKAVRLSYTNLVTPRAQDETRPEDLTFSTAILIPKSDTDTTDAVKAAIKIALEEGTVKLWKGKRPAGLRNPLRDGDEKTDKDGNPDGVYAGHWFLNAKGPKGGKERPVLMDKESNVTNSESVIYSGVEARVSLQFYPYDKAGNRGVACGIASVLSMETGEPLGNIVTPESARAEFGVTAPKNSAASDFDSSAPSEGEKSSSDTSDNSTDDDDPWGE